MVLALLVVAPIFFAFWSVSGYFVDFAATKSADEATALTLGYLTAFPLWLALYAAVISLAGNAVSWSAATFGHRLFSDIKLSAMTDYKESLADGVAYDVAKATAIGRDAEAAHGKVRAERRSLLGTKLRTIAALNSVTVAVVALVAVLR